MATRSDIVKASIVVAWLAVQGTLVLTAGSRPESAFGFRMFGEASSLQYSLARLERDARGVVHEQPCPRGRCGAGIDWHDWVKVGGLGAFDREITASYSVAAQLQRLEAAVHSFTAHEPVDAGTVGFVLTGWTQRNGGPHLPFRFEARK